MNTFTYRDLMRVDGSVNRATFDAILASRVQAEINLALCVAAGIMCPRHVDFATVENWRADTAATVNPALVSATERRQIARNERIRLLDWVIARTVRT